MKHSTPSSTQRSSSMPGNAASKKSFAPEILADSLEVMEMYSRQKINLLEAALNQLPIADNTLEIISLCQQIKKERILLEQIMMKKISAARNNQ